MQRSDPVKTKPARLSRLLLAKLAFDLLFLIAAVVGYGYASLPPPYRGWVDWANTEAVSGWAGNEALPNGAVQLQLFVDGTLAGQTTTQFERRDIHEKYPLIPASCGFWFEMPPLTKGEHSVRVFAVDLAGADKTPTVRQIGKTLFVTSGQD